MVYFKLDSIYHTLIEAGVPGIIPDCIVSFDLESEEWRDVLWGPISDIFFTDDEYDKHLEGYPGVFLQTVLVKPPATGSGKPDRFDWLPEKTDQIQISNQKRQFNQFPPISRPV